MTLLFSAPNHIQNLQLGLNEIASALVIGKSVGSLFSRQTDANIFSVLESQFGVCLKLQEVPGHLENVKFSRSTLLHGEKMRHIKGPWTMGEVEIYSLEGYATFIVLCCRYTHPTSSILEALVELICGDFIPTVNPGKLVRQGNKSPLPHMVKPLLANFIRATIDSDADSLQSQRAKRWMAELGAQIGMSLKIDNSSINMRQKTLDIVCRLIGGSWFPDPDNPRKDRREYHEVEVYDTMSMAAAYIALAALANGVDLSVECITRRGGKMIAQYSENSPARFQVRLWLCQPPLNIYNFLAYQEGNASFKRHLSSNEVIFGGELEVALNIANEVGYSVDDEMEGKILKLWTAGCQEGQSLTWTIKPFQKMNDEEQMVPPLRFQLVDKRPTLKVSSHVDALARSWGNRDLRLRSIARNIARIVDQEYLYEEYEKCPEKETVHAAMDFVLIAMAIGSLWSLTIVPGANSTYALNMKAITPRGHENVRESTGELSMLILRAFGQGLLHKDLLWAGALLWGGASHESQGYCVVNDRVLGIVAPHCTIILEVIRDPLGFATEGLRGKLLSVHKGSVPMLPRDPRNGFVQAADLDGRNQRSAVQCDWRGLPEPSRKPVVPEWEMVITFEPDVLGGSINSVFCGWYGGDLALELDPLNVFRNLLMRRFDARDPAVDEVEPRRLGNRVRRMGILDLLQRPRWRAENGFVIFHAYSAVDLLVACAGTVQEGHAVVHIGPLEFDHCHVEDGDTLIHYEP